MCKYLRTISPLDSKAKMNLTDIYYNKCVKSIPFWLDIALNVVVIINLQEQVVNQYLGATNKHKT